MSKTDVEPPERFDQLDGLRGIAALIVVISHSANAGLLPSVLGRGFGQMGVTLFYALSAFLLGHLYFRSTFSNQSLHRYAVSRVSRVLPLFYAVLALAVAVFLVTGYNVYGIETGRDIFFNAALIQGTSVLWSIPVELQYYVCFAVLWWLHMRRGWALWQVVVLGLAIQAVAALSLRMFFPQAGTYNLLFWGHIFLFGLVFSQIPRPKLSQRMVPLQAIVLVALLLIALPELRRQLGLPTLPIFADPLTSGVPLLLLYLALREARPLQFLNMNALRWLGGVSFGLYLIHMPVVGIVAQMDGVRAIPGAGFVLILAVSLFLSWLARHVIELPAQSFLRARLSRPKPVSKLQAPSR